MQANNIAKMRENTVCIDFQVCPIRPPIKEVEKLLRDRMKLDFSQCKAIQMHHVRNCVLITFHGGREAAEQFVKQNSFKHAISHQQTRYTIPVYIEDDAIEVKVHDLPIQAESNAICKQMEAYGEVVSTRYDKWKNFFGGVYSGVRIVRMRLHRAIPSYVSFKLDDFSDPLLSRVSYANQRATCQYCSKEVHFGISCAEAAKGTSSPTDMHLTTTSTALSQLASTNTQVETPTPVAVVAETPTIAKTPTMTEVVKAAARANQLPPTDEFTTVNKKTNRRNKPKDQEHKLQQNVSESSEDESMDSNAPLSGDVAEIASPPRKKIITRASKQQHQI